MFLDTLVALIGSFIALIVEGVSLVVIPLINIILAGIEAVLSIFFSSVSLGRVPRKERASKSSVSGIVIFLVFIGVVLWVSVVPIIVNRSITLVAKDGHSLPFAAVIIHSGDTQVHKRTDNAGNLVIPRFGTDAVTVKDPRYVEHTWKVSEIEQQIVVERSLLGAGIDSIAGRLLQK